MWRWMKPAKVLGVGMLMLVVAGCTISIQPWTKPAAPSVPVDAPPGHPYVPANYQGPAPKPFPPNVSASNEATSQMIRELKNAEDQRNALVDQVQSLRKQLKDREDNLRQASYEMDESSKYLKRTREEFRQWQTEMDDLRDRVRKLEDYRSALKPLIEEILHELYREKETPKTLRLHTPGAK
jgi:peptidoglycan hydrolase CwlO-like protein